MASIYNINCFRHIFKLNKYILSLSENKYASSVISEDRLNAKVHFAPSKEDQIELMKLFKVNYLILFHFI